ncbi:MAG: protease [Opitutia bacterium]|nr:MAG: protease [Opitutae bacterium]
MTLPLSPIRSLITCLSFGCALQAAPPAGYYRFPSLHAETIVFTAEGDLWRVGVAGGTAQRLTTHPGTEQLPAISPDGQSLAFTAHYEGQSEVCVMPLAGGPPTRLTYEGEASGALVRGWTPDGRILYSTLHFATLPNRQLVALDPRTRARTVVPLAQADEGVYDDAGKILFFTRLSAQSSHAKRYHGGTAQNLWRLDESETAATPLTAAYAGTSRWPMWWQGRVFFASDRDGTMNLWSMKPDGTDLRQLTKHTDFGVKNPSLHRGRISYQNGADLWLLDLATTRNTIVPITLASDFDQLREKWVAKPIDYVTHLALSPTGDRVALTVRGEVFVAPTGQGRFAAITRGSGVRYREANFVGDGKSLLVLSDESGEVEFWRAPANGVGPREQITKDAAVLRLRGLPSPDGSWVASAERDQELWLFNTKTAEKRRLAESAKRSFDAPDFAWSPDSQWLAFVNSGDNDYSVIWLYSVATDKAVAVTSPRTESSSPAWSPDGKWLYFLSERALQSVVPAPWGLRQPEPFLDRPVKIYQLALSADTKRSPFQPDDELAPEKKKEPAAAAKKDSEKEKDAEPAAKSTEKKPAPVVVQLDGLVTRLWEVPVAAGNYSRLTVNDKSLFLRDASRGAAGGPESGSRLLAVEIKNKDIETVTVADGVSSHLLSGDGKKMLLRRANDLFVIDAVPKSATSSLDKAKVNLAALKFSFDPRESWRQMFTDAWRLHRDYFYDPGMHGVDWKANLAKHLPLVARVTDRAELNDALAYMMSETAALHTGVMPGDVRGAPEDEVAAPASLGARLVRDQAAGGWRLEQIYAGDPDYPDKLSPLVRPGLRFAVGDIIESINGTATLSVPAPESLLRNQAGRQVLLHVKPAGGGEAFDAIVTPLNTADAASLRYTDWEQACRQRVDEAAASQIGYVHLRAMGTNDYAQWAREFYPVANRAGLILDLRNNRGGNIDSWILSRLMRKPWMWWAPRFGGVNANMQSTFRGHLVVLVNEWTASDGEAMANGVRHLGLGAVLGTRTWGGGIWLRSGINALADRGYITAAENGSFIPGEGWTVEGPGIAPDVIVDNNPAATFRGTDAQLDAAVAKLKELIAKDPRPVPKPPPYPVKP